MKVIQRKFKDANKILVIKFEGTAPLGEKKKLKETVCDQINLAVAGYQWLTVVNTAINIHLPYNVGNSKLGWMTKLL